MALVRWGAEEEEEKKDPFSLPSIKPVQSVQNSWQPTNAPTAQGSTSSPTIQDTNYLMSDQKAQIDEQKRQQDEAERQAAAARAAAAAEAARAAQAAQTSDVTPVAPKSKPKYQNQDKEDKSIWGFLKGVGAGIQQGIGAVGDVAIQGGSLVRYAGDRLSGMDDAQAAQRMTQNADAARGWLHGQKDITGRNIIGTRDVDQQAGDIAAGRGDFDDFMAVGGKGLQVGIDSTMFLNPARMAVTPITGAARTATTIPARVMSSPAARYAMRDAAFYGGLQNAATTAQQLGAGEDLDDALLAGLRDGLTGAVLQGTLDLGGHMAGQGVRRGWESVTPVANKTINSLRQPREFRVGDELADGTATVPQERRTELETLENSGISVEPAGTPAQPNQGTAPLPTIEQPSITPEVTPVADGVVQTPVDNIVDNSVEPRVMDDITPVTTPEQPVDIPPSPVADGTTQPVVMPESNPNMPMVRSDEVRQLQDARAGASQAEEAQINQQLQQIDNATPRTNSNLPEGMSGDVIPARPSGAPVMNREEFSERFMPMLDDTSDAKQRIATAVGMEKDVESDLTDILRDGGVKGRSADRINNLFKDLQGQIARYNSAQQQTRDAYTADGIQGIDTDVTRQRSSVTPEIAATTRQLMAAIDRLEGSRDTKVAVINNLSKAIGTRNANILSSAGLIERNIAQEAMANARLALKNPVAMARSTFGNGNVVGSTAKNELKHWLELPENKANVIDWAKYAIGNTYRTGMIPTTALANTRRGMYRDEFTKYAYKELKGKELSDADAHKLAGAAGNEMEALVNTFIGVDNGMTNRKQATDALEAWKKYMKSGDSGDKAKFLERVEAHSSLADQMIAGLSKEDVAKGKMFRAMGHLIFPFVRTATNLMKTTAYQDINPFAKSLLDEIRADQRSGGTNTANLIKSKMVDYGIMGGAAALAGSGVLAFNDGDDIDKPRGWSIALGDDRYVPVRATAFELPMAMAGTAQQMVQDIKDGKSYPPAHYTEMITGSLPYLDQINTTTGAVDSLGSMLRGEEGADYAAKAYGVNMAKSFTPWTNNSLEAYVAGKRGESFDAKKVYDDESIVQWYMNNLTNSYPFLDRDSLETSRDAAGRARTMDNQGVVSNKTINDANTATYNDSVTSLVNYAREAGLGNGTQEMFNTYDTGKNNNFKSVQDSITFLDETDKNSEGKTKPNPANKLKQNEKIADLAQQIRNGFYGETGDELLTLNGQNLYSDVSVPGKNGGKNSRLPLSMQSIKNAIAQTDMSDDQKERMEELRLEKDTLYDRRKAGEFSYEQEQALRREIGQQEMAIMTKSENYQKLEALMSELDETGFFAEGGIGSTKSGQTYLWNSLNALLGSKGATPAANYPKNDSSGWGRGSGGGSGSRATIKPGEQGTEGIKWTPVKRRELAEVTRGRYTPAKVQVKLGNEIRKDKTQNYADRTF